MDPVSDEEVLALRLTRKGLCRGEYSRSFDKAGLVEGQIHAINEYQSMVAENPSARRTCIVQRGDIYVGESIASRPLEDLTQILIKNVQGDLPRVEELPQDCEPQLPYALTSMAFPGKALYGTLCAPPLKTAGLISTVLEDDNGAAVLVCIQNAISLTASDAEVAASFSEGRRVVIKEPLLKINLYGILEVRVTNPANFVLLCRHGKPAGTAVGELRSHNQEDVDTLLPQLQGQGFPESLLCDHCSPADPDITDSYFAYFKRVEMWLRQEKWLKAFRDLDAVKAMVPESARPAYQLLNVQVLAGMQCHAEAKACLEDLQAGPPLPDKNSVTDSILQTIKRTIEEGEKQSKEGKYELDDYLEACELGRPTELKCSEYVHPGVEVAYLNRARCIRGVFATHCLKRGQLLVASRAVVMVDDTPAYGKLSISMGPCPPSDSGFEFPQALSPFQEDIITTLVPRMQACPKVALQVLNLQDDVDVLHLQDYVVYCRPSTVRNILPKRLLRSSYTVADVTAQLELYADEHVAIDINRLRRIVMINSLRKPGNAESGGIWIIPSFFNHSCMPNCSWYIVGDMIFISVNRAIARGEELVLPFFNITRTWFSRQATAQRMLFSCVCPRCSFEEKLLRNEPVLLSLCKQYNLLFESSSTAGDITTRFTIQQAHDLICSLEKFLRGGPLANGKKLPYFVKSCIRSCFAESYAALYTSCAASSALHRPPPRLTISEFVISVLNLSNCTCTSATDILILLVTAIRGIRTSNNSTKRRKLYGLERFLDKVCKNVYIPLHGFEGPRARDDRQVGSQVTSLCSWLRTVYATHGHRGHRSCSLQVAQWLTSSDPEDPAQPKQR